jgi:hypothetical protein
MEPDTFVSGGMLAKLNPEINCGPIEISPTTGAKIGGPRG